MNTIIYLYEDSSWGDLLTSYNGRTITYDTIGNPLNDGIWSYTWEQGRRLTKMQSSSATWNYAYDTTGLRTSRSNGTTNYRYWYNDSGLLLRMEKGSTVYSFTYDPAGRPVSVTEGSTRYYYILNQQGDVIGLLNSNEELIVMYVYDAWGRVLASADLTASGIGTNNPLRYRGYVYDTETGLYYLQSRYYNPTWGRFINADSQLSTGDVSGLNLFAYCGNNPVNRIDPTGEAWYHWLIGGLVVAACAVATVATCGGFSAAMTAIGLVSHGIAATSTAATVATAAFIGSATTYGMAMLSAASNSHSLDEFYAQGNWGTVAATTFFGSLGALDGYKMHRQQTSQSSISNHVLPEHKSGRSRPSKNPVPNGSYTQYDDYGDIYSYAQYDGLGRQTLRIDFQGRPHNGVLPHIHLYTYPELGGKGKYVFDLMWNLID